MPHTVSDLISSYSLSESDVHATLTAAGLPLEQIEYSDEDIRSSFDVIREFFDTQQVTDYESAAKLFASRKLPKTDKTRSRTKTDVEKSQNQTRITPTPSVEELGTSSLQEMLSVTDLLSRVREHLDLKLTLKEALSILETSGLPDKDLYTQSECDRFIGACSIVGNNGKHNIGTYIQDAATESELGLIGLVDEVTYERAKNVPGLVNQLYMKNVAQSLAQQEGQIESFYLQLKDSILAGIEGKSPLRSIMEAEWIPKSLSESPPNQNLSLPKSDDGMTIDLISDSKPNDEQ